MWIRVDGYAGLPKVISLAPVKRTLRFPLYRVRIANFSIILYHFSDEYRQEFDRYLNIGQLRKEVGFTTASDVKGNTVVTNRVEEGT